MGPVFFATTGHAHPTDLELHRAYEERQLCETSIAAVERVDPVRLGMREDELKAAVEGLRRESPASDSVAAADVDPVRWIWEPGHELLSVEYEVWHGRVYRIRWQLAEDFERPVFDELRRRGDLCFGPPDHDQIFEAKPGSPKATLRRVTWSHGDRRIELRQLHPLHGGPVYLTIQLTEPRREIAASGARAAPDPDRTGPWWRRPAAPLRPATDAEREALGNRFAKLLAQLDH